MTNPGRSRSERPDHDLPTRFPPVRVDDPGTSEAEARDTETTIIEANSSDTALSDTAPGGTALSGKAPGETAGVDVREEVAVADQVDVQHVGLLQQAIRYFGTGVMSAVVDFGLLLILMAVGIGYTPAKAASFIVGTLTAYSLNRRFTFKAQPSKRRFLLTMLSYAITFVLQVGIFSALFPVLTAAHLPHLAVQTISYVFGQGAATVANFSMQRWLIFRPSESPARGAGAAAVD